MKKLFSIFAVVVLTMFGGSAVVAQNAVNPGKVKVTVKVHPDGAAEDLSVKVTTLPLFALSDADEVSTALTRTGNSFVGEVATDCIESLCAITFWRDDAFIGGTEVELRQDAESTFDCYFAADGKIVEVVYPEWSTLRGSQWQELASVFQKGFMEDVPRLFMTDAAAYKRPWEALRSELADEVWPKYMENAVPAGIPASLPAWVMNNFKVTFAIDAVLPLLHNAAEAGVTLKDIPMEAYSFLSGIDYSADVLLCYNNFLPMGQLFKEILILPGAGIEAIGETPVAEWQANVGRILEPALGGKPQLLLDLLTAESYIMQIREGKALSEVQRRNIREGLSEGIGRLIK